jgi:hypothetical protein
MYTDKYQVIQDTMDTLFTLENQMGKLSLNGFSIFISKILRYNATHGFLTIQQFTQLGSCASSPLS